MPEKTYTITHCDICGRRLDDVVPARIHEIIARGVAAGAMKPWDAARYHDRLTGEFYMVRRCAA